MHKDANGTILNVCDGVMYIDPNGGEFEGIIIELLANNLIKIECETGLMNVYADTVFQLP